ncbi:MULTISPECIES: MarR family winged helix-turn-helix transcriptional regulator [unclassified Desulfovibrio]|uniref:MarR family winged helix-turn-helix transcriptional regulator n=1 Tax=unclassified Desulfovibrio TaxID=2593640 RepID=UPI0013EACB70|nr:MULTISPECIES: MarR family winged helix-turn-helix transcriptional regulator [unclassified Desulfovibrio]
MKSTQYCLLRCISNLGEPCLSDVSSALCMDQTTVSRNIDKLEQNGLIVTAPASEDPRRRLIRATPEGRTKLQAARAAWEQAQRSVKDRIGEEDFQQLYLLLDKIADVLG